MIRTTPIPIDTEGVHLFACGLQRRRLPASGRDDGDRPSTSSITSPITLRPGSREAATGRNRQLPRASGANSIVSTLSSRSRSRDIDDFGHWIHVRFCRHFGPLAIRTSRPRCPTPPPTPCFRPRLAWDSRRLFKQCGVRSPFDRRRSPGLHSNAPNPRRCPPPLSPVLPTVDRRLRQISP